MFNLSAGRKSFVGILLILSMLFSVGATVLAQEDLIVAKNEPTPTADPHDSHHTFTGPIVNLIFDRLITVDEDGNYAPELATDWEFSEDQTELRLTLREGVEFHDGSPFNAEAVKYNFERILDPDNALSARDRLTAIQDVEVLDEYQVQLNFDEPYGPLLNILSSFQVSMVSPEAAREYGVEEFDQNLVGTGPYEMKEWVRGERFVVERAGDYWGPEPQFDEVEFRPILEDSARVAALMTGEVDIIQPLPPQFVSSIEESSGKLVEATPGTRVFWVTMNTQEEPFDKTAVRQAMSYAIDYEALIDEVQYGYASKANSPLPPGVIGHSEHTRGYEYNPEMAEKLLDEAGYPDGFEFTLWIADEGWYPRLAESLAGFWEEIGVETNIDSYESGVYFDLLGEPFEENEVQMTINNWAQTDPYYMIEPLLHSRNWPDEGLNWAFYHNPLMEELIEEGARVAEPEQRTPYYRNAAQIIMSDAPWIIPYVIQNVVGYKEGLEGFWMEPGGVLRLEEAYWD